MVCAKCGAKLIEGCIYCSRCGQEVQIVSELSVLEEEYLRSLMDEKKDSEEGGDPGLTKDRETIRKREEKKEEKKLRKRKKAQTHFGYPDRDYSGGCCSCFRTCPVSEK